MEDKEETSRKDLELEVKALEKIKTKPILSVDYEAYAHLLENSDMTEEQKLQFVQALWSVIYGFASLRFGANPVHHIEKQPCGQVGKLARKSTSVPRNAVKFNQLNTHEGSIKRVVADQEGLENASQ